MTRLTCSLLVQTNVFTSDLACMFSSYLANMFKSNQANISTCDLIDMLTSDPPVNLEGKKKAFWLTSSLVKLNGKDVNLVPRIWHLVQFTSNNCLQHWPNRDSFISLICAKQEFNDTLYVFWHLHYNVFNSNCRIFWHIKASIFWKFNKLLIERRTIYWHKKFQK